MKFPQKHFHIFIVIFCSLCLLGVKPAKIGDENAFFHGYSIEKPIIKVGLGVNLSDIEITASSGMKIYEINSRYKLIADDADEVRIKGHREELSEKYLVQVAQTKDKKEAEAITRELRSKIENKIYIKEDKEKVSKIKDEMADILIYLFILSNRLDIDVASIMLDKIEKNKQRFSIGTTF